MIGYIVTGKTPDGDTVKIVIIGATSAAEAASELNDRYDIARPQDIIAEPVVVVDTGMYDR